jgi:hypothetical protein
VAAAPSAEARAYCGEVTMRYSYVLHQSIPLDKEARGWECIKRGAPRPYDVVCGGPAGAEDFSRRVGAVLAE